ncbi:MAG: ComEC/Rec2 family competence protein [Rhodospirillaceae bacterium]|nr:ComEC/Rec2 family competence protein [Rhodospirillaceae bacterium]
MLRRSAGLRIHLDAAWAAERRRVFLWVPVLFGAGSGLYLTLPVEPIGWIAPVAAGLFAAAALLMRRHTAPAIGLAALALLAAGVAAADWRSERVSAPVLADPTGPVDVSGRVVWVGAGDGAQRYLLDQVRIERLAPAETPARVRLSVRRSDDDGLASPGTWLSALASLRPPPAPAEPGAWDFARQAWFQQIGAVGFVYGAPKPMAVPSGEGGGPLSLLSQVRHWVSTRILAHTSPSAGPFATALLTGDRSAIEKTALKAMRDSGLAHLLAISGLHVGLIAGFIFFATRGLLALIEPLALRAPIKKWAAACALLGAAAYLLLSGMSVPTQRAFVMVGVVLVAIMLDRASLSMRLIAWAALLVLAIAPESMLGPSFQMSFAAATALIATYEAARGLFARMAARSGLALRPLVYAAGVALTSLVAGIATGPFAVYHFNRIADYGLLANLGAVPITGFWIMPWGLVALILMPFGLEGIALAPMGWGIDAVVWIARQVAAQPGAVTLVPAMPAAALLAISVGGLWLCLWRSRWRFLGILVIGSGIVLAGLERRPDILVDGDAKVMAARGEDGRLWISTRQRGRFVSDIWLRRDGQAETPTWPRDGKSAPAAGIRCDTLGCIQRRGDRTIAFVRDPRAFEEDCRRAELVVSAVPSWDLCEGPETVVDRFDLWRGGGHAIWLDEDGARVESVARARGERPWVARRPPAR